MKFIGGSDGKESACNARDLGSIPKSGRSPGERTGNALQAWRIPWTEQPGWAANTLTFHLQVQYMYACMWCMLSCVWFFETPWVVAHQVPLSMGFPRQKYWSGLPFPTLGDLPDPGIELTFPASPVLAGRFFTNWATWEYLL